MSAEWKQAAAALLLAVTAGCTLAPQREAVDSYDLGPPAARAASAPGFSAILLVPEISAPAWLDGQGILYRLSYENEARPQAYARSRWVAPPAALLTQRLRGGFAGVAGGIVTGADGARAHYALRVELEDFSQSFAAPGDSRVALRARASLVRLADRSLVAQRVFQVERAAPTADARGAVAALRQAGDDFVGQALAWTSEHIGKK
jgi:cholesterol transport system auxiliary component